MAELIWWAYLHEQGTVAVKRFFDKRDLEDATASPFVKQIMQPFIAPNYKEAHDKAFAFFYSDAANPENPDLIDRLRYQADVFKHSKHARVCLDAISELERLQNENIDLRGKLDKMEN